jgi:hypothetical protein
MDDLSRLLKEFFEYSMTDVHTAFPGVVIKYDPATRRADIQPSIKRKMPDGLFLELPIITEVPVLFFGTKKYTIHIPLEKDDEVLIIVTERALDTWKSKGGKGVEEKDPRRFDLIDCIAIPGLQQSDFIPVTEAGLNIIHKTKSDGDIISQVTMDDEKINVKYKEKALVLIEDDHIKASTEKCVAELTGEKIDITNGKDKITADSGNVEVSAATKATIKSSQVEITGGNFSLKGTVTPGNGPLCALPNCLFTGAPHGGNMAAGT